jgi:hypothetical protein
MKVGYWEYKNLLAESKTFLDNSNLRECVPERLIPTSAYQFGKCAPTKRKAGAAARGFKRRQAAQALIRTKEMRRADEAWKTFYRGGYCY